MVIPKGCIRTQVAQVVASVHTVASWTRLVSKVPFAMHASGRYLDLRLAPYSPQELGLSTASVPSATVALVPLTAADEEAKASIPRAPEIGPRLAQAGNSGAADTPAPAPTPNPATTPMSELDRDIQSRIQDIGFWPVERLKGRRECQLYEGSKPVKEKDLAVRFELDLWLSKVLVHYPDLITGVARGDVWTIWGNMVRKGKPRKEDIATRLALFRLQYIYTGQNAAQYVQRMDAEVLLLGSWGQRISPEVVLEVKINGLRYTLEVQAGQNLLDHELTQSHYHKIMWDLDKVTTRELHLEDYLEEIARYEEEEGRHKARAKVGKKVAPVISLKASEAKRFCFDFQGPDGSCTRNPCNFIHEKNAAALEWLTRQRSGKKGKGSKAGASPGLFQECKEQGVCFNFNSSKGCEREQCRFEHEKVSVVPAKGKSRKCTKCNSHHKSNEACVTSAHQAGGQSDQEEEDEEEEEEGYESGEQTETGTMATVLRDATYAQNTCPRKGSVRAKAGGKKPKPKGKLRKSGVTKNY